MYISNPHEEFKKVYGITEDGDLVIINPEGTIKIKERVEAPYLTVEPTPIIPPKSTPYITGNVRRYIKLNKGGTLLEDALSGVIKGEIEKLQDMKKYI